MTNKKTLAHLTPLQYAVTQNQQTERAFSGEFNDFYHEGEFFCICCDNKLFASETKYNSSSGWPSFYQTANDSCTVIKKDFSLSEVRKEVCCAVCDAHLGHVFDDGPQPTSKRYCINSASLSFRKKN